MEVIVQNSANEYKSITSVIFVTNFLKTLGV